MLCSRFDYLTNLLELSDISAITAYLLFNYAVSGKANLLEPCFRG